MQRALLEHGYIVSTGGGAREVVVLTPAARHRRTSARWILRRAAAGVESETVNSVSLVEDSEALHERVTALRAERRREDFDELALSLARFQARHSPGMRAAAACSVVRTLDRVADIPAVPCDAFRLARVAVHPQELDAARFVTSGTTGERARRARHFAPPTTYRELALSLGHAALLLDRAARRSVVALRPGPAAEPRLFARLHDGKHDGALRWSRRARESLADRPSGRRRRRLRRAARLAARRGRAVARARDGVRPGFTARASG